MYQVVAQELESVLAAWEYEERSPPAFVKRRLRGYLRCGLPEWGFTRVYCAECREDAIVAFSCKDRGYAVTGICEADSEWAWWDPVEGRVDSWSLCIFLTPVQADFGRWNHGLKEALMLDIYFSKQFTIQGLRKSPAGRHLDGFAAWLHSRAYKRRPAQLRVRGVAHFGHWHAMKKTSLETLDEREIDAFADHCRRCRCRHDFGGRARYNSEAARLFVNYLRDQGAVPKKEAIVRQRNRLVCEFANWMRRHRGIAESTLKNYLSVISSLVNTLGDDPARYTVDRVRDFVAKESARCGFSQARAIATPTRVFLRFLTANGLTETCLASTIETPANWTLSSLPRYISAEDVDRLIAVCDPGTPAGARDRAIILLLARLGLRAQDTRELRLQDVDWSNGRIRVMGKGRRETWLPLPQEAGDAMLHYLVQVRPPVDEEHVFLRVHAPIAPFPSSGAISKIVRRAIQRSGITTPSMGAHLLRHSAATQMLRDGVALETIGAVLRHRSVDTTAHYAKVDVDLLKLIAAPWPHEGEGPC